MSACEALCVCTPIHYLLATLPQRHQDIMQYLSLEVSGTKSSELLLTHMHIVSLLPPFVLGMEVSQGNVPHGSTTVRGPR